MKAAGVAVCGFGVCGVLWLLVACGDVAVQPIGTAAGDGGVEGSTVDGPSQEGEAAPPGDASSFCTGQGPIPIGPDQCSGDVARLFRFAACACDSLAVSGVLQTYSTLDGGPGTAASIAANGQVATNAQATVGGSVWAGGQALTAGTPAVSLMAPAGATSTIALDVESGGDMNTSGTVLVGRDVFANGNVTVQSGSLSVVGTVHVPAGDTANGVTTGGSVLQGPVQVNPPCDCSSAIPIASIVAAHKTSNDDSVDVLQVNSLDNPPGAVTLPCGLYYVDGILGTTAPVTINVIGRVALFVDGDIDTEQGLTVTLAAGAELDLFVAGNMTFKGSTVLGDTNAPARMRLYAAGSGLTLAADATVGANVYAPNADVQLASNFAMWGSFFAGSLQFSGSFAIYYDTSVLLIPGCRPTGSTCTTCDDCSGATPSCKAGTCSPCTSTADCCAPLECDKTTGYCQPPNQ